MTTCQQSPKQFNETCYNEHNCQCDRGVKLFAKHYIILILCNIITALIFASGASNPNPIVQILNVGMSYLSAIGQNIVFVMVFNNWDIIHPVKSVLIVCCNATIGCSCCISDSHSVNHGVYCCRCTTVHYIRFLWYHSKLKIIMAFLDMLEAIAASIIISIGGDFSKAICNILIAIIKLSYRIYKFIANGDISQQAREANVYLPNQKQENPDCPSVIIVHRNDGMI